jgi:ligand-binding sensor domain-containing protein
VGTPLGVAQFEGGRLARVLAKGAFTESLAVSGHTLFVGTMDQGILRVALDAGAALPGPTALAGSTPLGEIRQLYGSADGVYAVEAGGLYELSERGLGWKKVVEPPDSVLADGNISALAVQPDGSVWVGHFDRGLDILAPDGRRTRHVEDEHVFCVNRIVPGRGETVAVATANGLVIFDRAGVVQQVIEHNGGLISEHVTDVLVDRQRMIAATPAGLTFFDGDGARSLYAFQGLVNNHVYALGSSGSQVLAGTLGGISVLDGERVVGNYTTDNSNLRRNWISAVVPLGYGWMVGTYGGGVMRLDDTGRFHPYEFATGDIEINPNAMLATESHVFAGSLGKGLLIYDRATDRWHVLREALPSLNVTALAAAGGYIYVGTDNGLVRVREKDVAP